MIPCDAVGNPLKKDDLVLMRTDTPVIYAQVTEVREDGRVTVIAWPTSFFVNEQSPRLMNIYKAVKPPATTHV